MVYSVCLNTAKKARTLLQFDYLVNRDLVNVSTDHARFVFDSSSFTTGNVQFVTKSIVTLFPFFEITRSAQISSSDCVTFTFKTLH